MTSANNAPQATGAAQAVFDTPELYEMTLMEADPKSLIDLLKDGKVCEAVQASPRLQGKLYLNQQPEIPFTNVPWANEFERSTWEPNRILCPDDKSYCSFRIPDQHNVGWQIRVMRYQQYTIPRPKGFEHEELAKWKKEAPLKVWYQYRLLRFELTDDMHASWGPVLSLDHLAMHLASHKTPVTVEVLDEGPYRQENDPKLRDPDSDFLPNVFSHRGWHLTSAWLPGSTRLRDLVRFVEAWRKDEFENVTELGGICQYYEGWGEEAHPDDWELAQTGRWVAQGGGTWLRPVRVEEQEQVEEEMEEEEMEEEEMEEEGDETKDQRDGMEDEEDELEDEDDV